jgi:hypothetical protein
MSFAGYMASKQENKMALYKKLLKEENYNPFDEDWLKKQDSDTLLDVAFILTDRIEELGQRHLFIVDWMGASEEKEWSGNGGRYAVIESTMDTLYADLDTIGGAYESKAMIINSHGKQLGEETSEHRRETKNAESEYSEQNFLYLELAPLGESYSQSLNRHAEHCRLIKEDDGNIRPSEDQWFEPSEAWEESGKLVELHNKIIEMWDALEVSWEESEVNTTASV